MTNQDDINHTIALIKTATANIERHHNAAALQSITRSTLIQQLHRAGLTTTRIARAIGLTRSRVHQILYPNGKGQS